MEINNNLNLNLDNAYTLLRKKIQEDSNRGLFFTSQHYIQKYSHFFEQWNFQEQNGDWKNWLDDFLEFKSLNDHFMDNGTNEIIIQPGTNANNQFTLFIFATQNNSAIGHCQNSSIKTFIKTGEDWNQSVEHLSMKLGLSWNFQNPFLSFDCTWANIPVRLSLVHYALKANLFHTILLRKKMPLEVLGNVGNGKKNLYPEIIGDLLRMRCNVVV